MLLQAAGDGSEDVVQVRPEEFSSLPPSPSPVDVVPKPVISLHQVRPITHTVAVIIHRPASDVTIVYTMMLGR